MRLALIILISVLLRCLCLYQFEYPTGPDYGMHMYYAEVFQNTGFPPSVKPFFQLGKTEWLMMNGAPLLYLQFASYSGSKIFDILRITVIWTLIEVVGVYILAWEMFRLSSAALSASAIAGVLPSYIIMMAGGGYPNISALALIPFAFVAWLRYWKRPSVRTYILAVLLICGAMSMHHVSTMWIALTLALFSITSIARTPKEAINKVLPVAIGCFLIGLPIFLNIFEIYDVGNALGILSADHRFSVSRFSLDFWIWLLTPASLFLLVTGTFIFVKARTISYYPKMLILSYLAVSLFFGFGWLFEINFDYARALYFLGIPLAIGTGAIVAFELRLWHRTATFSFLLVGIALVGMLRSPQVSDNNNILTYEVVEAMNWLISHSEKDDVIVVGSVLGFHISRLTHRPNLIAMSPEIIGISSELQYAEIATKIMLGDPSLDRLIEDHNVKYIVIRTHGYDIPKPQRSELAMSFEEKIELVYSNIDVNIYEYMGTTQ